MLREKAEAVYRKVAFLPEKDAMDDLQIKLAGAMQRPGSTTISKQSALEIPQYVSTGDAHRNSGTKPPSQPEPAPRPQEEVTSWGELRAGRSRQMEEATADNNRLSRYIESEERIQRHRDRAYDDREINDTRWKLEKFTPTRLPESIEVNTTAPINLLPKPATDLIRSVAAGFEVAPEMALIPLLGTVLVAGRGNFMIRVKESHREALTEYIVGAASSAQRKSAVGGFFRNILDEIEGQLRFEHAAEGRDVTNALTKDVLKQMERKLISKLAKLAITEGIEAAQAQMRGEIEALDRAQKTSRLAKRQPRFLTDLTTMEKLAVDMEAQQEAIGVFVSEGGFWKQLPSNKDDLLLRAYTAEPYSISTKTAGSISLKGPVMTLCTLIQPGVLDDLYSDEKLKDHGLLARILPAYIPAYRGNGLMLNAVPAEHRQWLKERVLTLMLLKRPDKGDGVRNFHVLDIDDEGKDEIVQYQRWIAAQMRDGQFDHYQPFGGKLAGHAIRLAGAVHLMKHAVPQEHKIDMDSVACGISLAEFFRQHAAVAFDPMARNGVRYARKILDWIKDKNLTHFTTKEVQRAVNGHGDGAPVRAGMAVLEQHNIIRQIKQGKSTIGVVHPRAHMLF